MVNPEIKLEMNLLTMRMSAKSLYPFCKTSSCLVSTAALTSEAFGKRSIRLLAGLGGSGGKLLGVRTSTTCADFAGVLSAGERGCLRKIETSRISLTGVPSLIGSRAVIRRPVDDLGFSIVSVLDGAKRPLITYSMGRTKRSQDGYST